MGKTSQAENSAPFVHTLKKSLPQGSSPFPLESREEDVWLSEQQLAQCARADEADELRSPIPTQMVSNGECMPFPQTEKQKRVEARIQELADTASKTLGMGRRKFLTTTGGFAAAFLAINEVFGRFFNVSRLELFEPAASGATGAPLNLFALNSLPPLVFIHGMKGSSLVDAEGRLQWLTLWQALGLASPRLSLPLEWSGETQQSDGLRPQAPLRAVGGKTIYGPFLDWAAKSRQEHHPFAYDWRRDNLESAERFIAFLEAVRNRSDGNTIQVVAHSMGGLICFAALNRRPDLFHSVLFVGVPFRPAVGFLEDMHAGTPVGFNRRILSPEVLFTFASPYCLFSTNPRESGLVERDGEPILHDWYSADDWQNHKLGIFSTLAPGDVTKEQRAHLHNALLRAKKFRDLLMCSEEPSFRYPPIAILASDIHPTLSTVVRSGPHAVKGWDFKTARKQSGDGRVGFLRALPPDGVPYTLFRTSREHADLLNATTQVSEILAYLCKQRATTLASIRHYRKHPTSRLLSS